MFSIVNNGSGVLQDEGQSFRNAAAEQAVGSMASCASSSKLVSTLHCNNDM